MADINIFGRPEQTTIADTDKIAAGSGTSAFFNITFLNFKKLFSGLWFGGGEKISAVSTGIEVAGSTSHIGDVSPRVSLSGNASAGFPGITISNTTQAYEFIVRGNQSNALQLRNSTNLADMLSFDATTSNGTFSGIVTAAGFVPFTGCHIAKSNENLQLGELVQIKSIGWVNPKQPDWIAEYCNGSIKGVYGVVYDIQIVDIIEDEIKTGEFTQYLIAAVGDGFISVDCACECGDYLIPSETKGLATVYNSLDLPKNFVGKAGQDSIGGKIAWTKE